MRHQKRGNKLSRSRSHRKAMLSNMAASLLIHKQVRTTEAKAKEVRRLVERLITYGKKESTHARRLAFAVLRDKKATGILFDEVAPLYTGRQGGYTRIIKLGYRPNDTAKLVLLQLVDFVGEEPAKEKKKTPKSTSAKTSGSKKKDVSKEKAESGRTDTKKTAPAKNAETTKADSGEKDSSPKAAEEKEEKAAGKKAEKPAEEKK